MAFKDGDFVEIEYTAWRAADNALLSTTDSKLAKEKGVYNEEEAETLYRPQLVVIGKGDVIKGVEDALRGMNVNEKKKVEIEPKDAFGERDPSLVRVIALSDFKKRDIEPYPGMRLDIDGTEAIVKSVNSGRVVVDENRPLAGEKLIYELTVVKKVDDDSEKIQAIAARIGLKAKSISISNGKVHVEFDENEKKTTEYEARKSALPQYIFKYMPSVEKVELLDTYTRTNETATRNQQQEAQQQ